jgi:hypothetical protein
MAVVSPEERSAAGGITGVARTAGAAVSPFFVGLLFARPALIGVPFFIAGGLKIVYDLLLYRKFIAIQPKDETVNSPFSSRGEESNLGSIVKGGSRPVLVEASDVQKGSES